MTAYLLGMLQSLKGLVGFVYAVGLLTPLHPVLRSAGSLGKARAQSPTAAKE